MLGLRNLERRARRLELKRDEEETELLYYSMSTLWYAGDFDGESGPAALHRIIVETAGEQTATEICSQLGGEQWKEKIQNVKE